MICSKCGSVISNGAAECSNCGNVVDSNDYWMDDRIAAIKQKNKNKKTMIVTIFVVFFVSFVAVIIFSVYYEKKKEEELNKRIYESLIDMEEQTEHYKENVNGITQEVQEKNRQLMEQQEKSE